MNSTIYIVVKDASLARDAEFLRDYLLGENQMSAVIQEKGISGHTIVLQLNPKMTEKEGYRISISSKLVTIEGLTPQGVFYGIQTLRKSLAGFKKYAILPAAVIEDAPRFAYRGMHLDVARHFFGVEFVKKYLDAMAMHNMNRFHFHLTDDQGWRVGIDRYPKLIEEGSKRNYTVLGRNSPIDDGTPYGGSFTKEELKEIVRYAQERFITVIPEIDMPGHMLGALKAYPELGCTGGPYEVEGHWGVFEDILCIFTKGGDLVGYRDGLIIGESKISLPHDNPVSYYYYHKGKGFHILGTENGDVLLYDKNKKYVTSLVGHSGAITHMDHLGWCFATSSYDHKICLWNLDDIDSQIAPIQVIYDKWPLCFTTDEKSWELCIGLAEGSIEALRISVEDNRRSIHQHLEREFTPQEWEYYMGKGVKYRRFKE